MIDESKVEQRLLEAMNSLFSPIVGCWDMHGCYHEFFYDSDAESYVLEVWPIGVGEPSEGNGHQQTERVLSYELAEFDFLQISQLALEHFLFSQARSFFEIGWKENNKLLEIRIHIVPK